MVLFGGETITLPTFFLYFYQNNLKTETMKSPREYYLISILIGFVFFIFNEKGFSQNTPTEQDKKFETAIKYLDRYYVDSINQNKLVEDAIRGMLKELDPHSVYLTKEEMDEMNEPLVGNFEGIGIQFNILSDTILVSSTIPGGPSEMLGIMAGDKIVKIDTQNVAGIGIKTKDVIGKLRGPKGTKVTVKIMRRGEKKLLEFTITRDKIPIFSLDASYMAEPEIGYIKVNRFGATTLNEFEEAMDTLAKQGMKHLILDLRGNSGGYLKTAIDLADEFLSSRKMIVFTQGVHFPKEETYATPKGNFETGKVVALIDYGSASASEIVAGALQDQDRGLIIGSRSYGKGLVQKPYTLPDGSVLRVTVQRYFTPSGRCIQKPYEEYKDEYSKRMESGEFFHVDSVHFPDSLKFFTPNKRVVYGGGGIMPDIFVPVDTSYNSSYYSEIIRKGLLYDFTVRYVDNNRKQIKKNYPSLEIFKKNFVIDEKIMADFIKYAEEKEVKQNPEQLKISEPMIKNQMKASIARGFWNTLGYWSVANEINNSYSKAIEALKNDSFEKFQLVYK